MNYATLEHGTTASEARDRIVDRVGGVTVREFHCYD